MATVTELNIERKKRVRTKRLRRFVLIALLGALMVLAAYARPLLEGVSVTAFMQEAFGTVGKSGSFPVSLVGETARSIHNLGGAAAVLTDTNVQVFSPAGRPYGTVQNGFAEPVLKTGGARGVLYGRGAKGLLLLTKGGLLAKTELDQQIITAEVASNGSVAAATPAQRYAAGVRVFDVDFNPVFTWYSAENHVVALGLNADASRLAVGAVTARAGGMVSVIKQFSVTAQSELCETTVEEAMVIGLKFIQRGLLAVTDMQTMVIDPDGTIKGSYSYAGKPLSGYSAAGNVTALALGEFKTEREVSVVTLDAACKVLFAQTVREPIRGLYTDGMLTYVLTDTALSVYNQKGQVQQTRPNTDGWIGIAASGEDVYLLLQHGVHKLAEQETDPGKLKQKVGA